MGGFIRKAVESYIHGNGPRGAGVLLRPLARLYETGVRSRLGLYSAGVLKSRSLPCHVISVGNITVGGTGKTPVTMYIARYLTDMGRAVVILSRGYGGSIKGIGVVSDGKNILLGPAEAGDEPVLMARRMRDVPVVVGADRYEAGLLAIKNFSPDIIILDDGFQHIRLCRDLNILLIDGAASLSTAKLLPAGPLREPLTALERADIVFVKGGGLDRADKELLRQYDIQQTGFVYRARGLTNIATGESIGVKAFKDKPVLALAAIANPDSFFNTLKDLGMKVAAAMEYSDHHAYSPADVGAMEKKIKETGAEAIITTEKDGVKLEGLLRGVDLAAYALTIDVELKDKALFRRAISSFIKGSRS